MNPSQFRRSQRRYLCYTLKCSPDELKDILNNPSKYYREWVVKKIDKATGQYKTLKDGTIKTRTIRESINELKDIQKRIKTNILSSIPLPNNVHGGVKGKSNITNSNCHKGKKYQFTTDLENFFPSITPLDVMHCLKTYGFNPVHVNVLTKLMTYKFEVPQGTPTSTHIANLVFLKTDEKLITFCNEHNLTYTRYVDDLTFSSDEDFKRYLPSILEIIEDSNFRINYRKTNYHGMQTITGIKVFNNYIDAPERIKKKAKEEIKTNSTLMPYSNYVENIRRYNRGIR